MTLRSWLAARILYLASQAVHHTARYQVYGKEHLDALEAAGQSVIWASWHGVTMMISGFILCRYGGNVSNMLVIVPDDWRGESLAGWADLLGSKAFAVSMQEESLVAARRLLQLVRGLESGLNIYINPDGPDGPSRVPKSGVSFLAGRSGAAVLPIGVHTSSRFQLPRWDRYSIPFPYSRICIVFGEPLSVARREDVRAAGNRIATAIDRVMAEAETRYHQP